MNLADNANLDRQNSAQPGSCNANTNLDGLEVADSEDDEVKAAASGLDDNHTRPCQRNSSSSGCQFIQGLSTAIDMAKNLRLLDLSNNGFSTQDADILYSSWSRSRFGSAQRHIKDQIIHLFVEGIKCCVKPCCRKD